MHSVEVADTGNAAVRIFTFTIFETHALPLRVGQHHITDRRKTLLESMSIVTVSETRPYHPPCSTVRKDVRPGTDSYEVKVPGPGLVQALDVRHMGLATSGGEAAVVAESTRSTTVVFDHWQCSILISNIFIYPTMVLGRLAHYAFDAILLSTVVAGVKRSTGFVCVPDRVSCAAKLS